MNEGTEVPFTFALAQKYHNKKMCNNESYKDYSVQVMHMP